MLTGNEQVKVIGIAGNNQLAATWELTTTGAIAALAAVDSAPTVDTSVSNTTGTTLTAAALVGGQISRSGPTAAFTDTTDTAAAIVAALPGFSTTEQFRVVFKNNTIYSQTLAAGAGVTLPGTVLVPALSSSTYFASVGGTSASPTVTFTHVGTTAIHLPASVSDPQSSALTTVGAGTITAAGIYGGVTLRGGTQTAVFTDTTDTAANIISLLSAGSAILGQSAFYTYVNNTVFPATITGGTGVTVSGITTVPANAWAKYLVTYTASGTVTIVGFEEGYFPSVGTFTANGASAVTVANAAITAGSTVGITLKTVGGTPAGAPYLATITPGTGFTVKSVAGDTSVYNYKIEG